MFWEKHYYIPTTKKKKKIISRLEKLKYKIS